MTLPETTVARIAARILLTAATLVVGYLLARLARSMLARSFRRQSPDGTISLFASRLVYAVLLAVTISVALGELGVETASIVAIIGAAGLAIGLALQGSLANLASGLLLVVLKPFKTGDYIEGAGQSGTVMEVGLFATVLRTFDSRKVVVPNSKLTDGTIVNYSTHPTRRLDTKVSVAYSSDLGRVREVLAGVLAAEPRVLADPAPVISVEELADSGVVIGLRIWLKSSDYWPVRFELLGKVKEAFDAAGIEIPFPQRDVHIKTPNPKGAN